MARPDLSDIDAIDEGTDKIYENHLAENDIKDFSKEFSKQRAKFFPYTIIITVAILAIIVGLPVFFFILDFEKTFLTIYLAICLVILLITIPSVIKFSTCPNCHKFMGRDISKFCPVCGVKIK